MFQIQNHCMFVHHFELITLKIMLRISVKSDMRWTVVWKLRNILNSNDDMSLFQLYHCTYYNICGCIILTLFHAPQNSSKMLQIYCCHVQVDSMVTIFDLIFMTRPIGLIVPLEYNKPCQTRTHICSRCRRKLNADSNNPRLRRTLCSHFVVIQRVKVRLYLNLH